VSKENIIENKDELKIIFLIKNPMSPAQAGLSVDPSGSVGTDLAIKSGKNVSPN
jgi:hypothetical protein